jgi:hypothetical protein
MNIRNSFFIMALACALSCPCFALAASAQGFVSHHGGGPQSDGAKEGIKLRLAGKPLDESRIGKISPAERDLLLAKQKLFDVDDQVASLIAMQHQIKQMQDELVLLKPRVEKLGGGGAAAIGTVTDIPERFQINPAEPAPATDISLDARTQLLWGAGAGLALLAVLTVFFGWRRKTGAQSNGGEKRLLSHAQALQAAPQFGEARSTAPGKPMFAADTSLSSIYSNVDEPVEVDEVDSLIEEAELYAVHGRADKAIEILNEIIIEHPEKVEVWLLLLSIFRSGRNAIQFETIAKKFLATIGHNDAWKDIQEIGRSIDPDNPLYFDIGIANPTESGIRVKPGKRRLLGDILVEINAISARELESSLADFDHLRDGRLGNYLVTRGLVKQNQLDEALKLQSKEMADESSRQKDNSGAHELPIKAGKPRPISDVLVQMGIVTEQDLDQCLASYDPKRHGHCGTYLMNCGLITKKQYHAALLQQLSGAMAVGAAPSSMEPPKKSGEDYIPWDMPDRLIR